MSDQDYDDQFVELLGKSDERALHELIHIMRKEAARIGLDLRENLERLGIAVVEGGS